MSVELTFRLFGVRESIVRERLADVLADSRITAVLFCENEDVLLRVTADNEQTAAYVRQEIDCRLGAYVVSTDGTTLEQRAVTLLKEKKKTVAVAESCTGGLLASRLTNVPGCSSVFGTGVVSYSWDCKQQMLGVSPYTLETYGAVSEQTAREMADGIRRAAKADIGIGITGEAGPQAAEDKAVGTVYVALADAKRSWVKELTLDASTMDREAIRRTAASHGLSLLCRYAQAYPTVMAGGERHGQITLKQPKKNANKNKTRLAAVLPWHSKGKARVLKIAAWICVLALIVLGVLAVYDRVFSPDTNRELQDELANVYWNDVSDLTVNSTQSDAYPSGMRSQFRALYDINRDIGGWVRIPETQINYPVMLYRDGYYSNHNFNDQFSVYGQPFFYETDTVDALSDTRVLAIHGNNTHDEQMFSSLLSYRRIAYLREHPVIEMNTVYTAARWEIFAVMVVDENERASEFEYIRKNFDEDAAFDEYITQLRKRSLFVSSAVVQPQDDIVLLITDVEKEYRFSGARLVVAARRMQNSEVETATYDINYRVVMPSVVARQTTKKTTTTTVSTDASSATTDVPTSTTAVAPSTSADASAATEEKSTTETTATAEDTVTETTTTMTKPSVGGDSTTRVTSTDSEFTVTTLPSDTTTLEEEPSSTIRQSTDVLTTATEEQSATNESTPTETQLTSIDDGAATTAVLIISEETDNTEMKEYDHLGD